MPQTIESPADQAPETERNDSSVDSRTPRSPEIRLIGRDHLLSREIYPRLRKDKSFILFGQAGIGKTALLKWSFDHYPGERKAYFSCCDRYGDCVKRIATALKIEGANKKSMAALEREILGTDATGTLFIDNIEEIKPQMINLLKAIPDWIKFLAGKDFKIKENFKPCVWAVKRIHVRPLSKSDTRSLAAFAIQQTGSVVDAESVIDAAKGVPGRIWACCRGEVLRDDDHVKGEEINILPGLIVFAVAAFIALRYTGKAAGHTDWYLIGGVGMALALLVRFLFAK